MLKGRGLFCSILFGLVVAGTATAQPAVPPLPDAALQARVAILEEENARLQSDYRILLTAACPAVAVASPTAAVAPPTVAAADNLERVADTSGGAQTRATPPEQRRDDQQLDDAAWSVSAVESRTVETTEAFVRIAWKVTIKNGIGRAQGFDFVVQFLDPDGTVVDTAHVGGEMVAASGERTITGEKQIPAPGGLRPLHIKAVANRKTR